MQIPFMRIDRQFAALREQMLPKVMSVLETGRVLQSPEIEALEKRLARLSELEYCVAVNSGTDALMLALSALKLPKGSAVAVPSMTFIASASAIVHNHCRPIFIDADPETMLMDTAEVAALIRTGSVQAVVVVHLYGQLLELEELAALAAKHGVPIVEDCAQSLGATRFGKAAGRHGRVACLSFDPTKVIGACGSGGALLTNDAEIARIARRLRYHGHAGNRIYDMVGYNWQMDSIQAAVIDVKLDHLAPWQERRASIAAAFRKGIGQREDIRPLATLEGNVHNNHKFVIQADRRDALQKHLGERGVQTSIHYNPPLHRQPCFADWAQGRALPEVDRMAARILSLPMYAELSDEETRYIVDAIAEFRA